jgi:membrane-bound serine protease (ClpP class)
MNIKYFYLFCLLLNLNFSIDVRSAESLEIPKREIDTIVELEINAAITPAIYNYIETAVKNLARPHHTFLLIHLNTPGGLVTTTKDILTFLGSQDLIYGIWVTPEGASATSAGAILAGSAHFIFMNEGTNIGAATPIGLGEDIEKGDAKSKILNDLVSLTQSLAEARNRKSEPFIKMIKEAKSYSAQEALKDGFINNIMSHRKQLKNLLDGKTTKIKGNEYIIHFSDPVDFKKVKMNSAQRLLNIFAHPSTAYILFIIGVALIYFELQAPGGYVAGGIGLISLILAGIGFQVLPLNFGSMGLIVLAFILFILEAFVTSFGLLTIGGIISLIVGSIFLYKTDDSFISLSLSLIISTALSILLYVALILWFIVKERKKNKSKKFFNFQNETGKIIKILERSDGNGMYHYQIKIAGEIWNAQSLKQHELNSEVKILNIDENHLTLNIE